MSSQEKRDQDEIAETFSGAEFVAARKEMGYSIEAVAANLNFSAQHIVSIEEGRITDLPNRVFALGYIRAYARYLELSEEKAVADYERVVGCRLSVAAKPLKSIGAGLTGDRAKKSSPKLLVSLVLLSLVAVAVWAWQAQSVVDTQGTTVPPTTGVGMAHPLTSFEAPEQVIDVAGEESVLVSSQPEVSVEPSVGADVVNSANEAPGQLDPQVKLVGETLKVGVPESEVAVEAQPAAVDSAVPEVAAQADELSAPFISDASAEPAGIVEPGMGLLAIRFGADCWVEVRDGSGRLLVGSVRNAERGVDVKGELPFHITLGALSTVSELTLNGDAVELVKRGNSNVLRFTLPSQQ